MIQFPFFQGLFVFVVSDGHGPLEWFIIADQTGIQLAV